MRLSIITINYNGSEDTIKLLESLQNQTDHGFQVVIIDNASEEADFKTLSSFVNETTSSRFYPLPSDDNKIEDPRFVKSESGQVVLLRNEQNLGFSGGNNVGIHRALQDSSDWVLLLNNDTWVESDFIVSVGSILSQKQGILGLPMDEGRRVSYCGKIRWLKPVGYHIYDFDQAKRDKDKHVIGGGMLIHKDVFEKIGFLDEKYFLYFEDVDYSIRSKKSGIPLEILEKPLVHHNPSSTTKKLGSPLLLRYHYRNALYFNFKNGPWYIKLLVWPWSLVILLKQAVKVMIHSIRLRITLSIVEEVICHNHEQSLAILNGVLDFYKNRMGKI